MHALKVILLLLLTLAVMRTLSWTVSWIAFRLLRRPMLASSLLGNVIALGLFTVFLFVNLAPGEPFDLEPLVFGVVVYAVFQAIDLRWTPWGRRQARVDRLAAREGP